MREGINKFHLSALGVLHTYKHTYKTHTYTVEGGIGGRCSGDQAVVLFDNNRLFFVHIRFIEYCSELLITF